MMRVFEEHYLESLLLQQCMVIPPYSGDLKVCRVMLEGHENFKVSESRRIAANKEILY